MRRRSARGNSPSARSRHGDRAMALARRHVGAGQTRGDLAARLAFGHRQAAVEPLGRRQRVARGERQPPERVERLGVGIEAGGVLPGGHRRGRRPRARLRPGAPPPPTAPPTPPAPRPPRGSAPGPRGRPPAPPAGPCATRTSVSLRSVGACPGRSPRLARRTSGALLRCSSSPPRRTISRRSARRRSLVPAARPARRRAARRRRRSGLRLRRGAPAPRARPRRRAPARAAAARSGSRPGLSSSALSVSSAARRSQPHAPLVGQPQPGAVEQQRGRAAPAVRRVRDATCRPHGLVDGVGGHVRRGRSGRRARVPRASRLPARSRSRAEQLDRERLVGERARRDLGRLAQEVQVVGLLDGQARQRLDEAAIGTAPLRAPPGATASATWRGSAASARSSAASAASMSWQCSTSDGGDARVQIAARGRRPGRARRRRPSPSAVSAARICAALERQRLVQRQQHRVARIGRRVRIDEQAGGLGEAAQPDERPHQAAPRLEPLRREREGGGVALGGRARIGRRAPRASCPRRSCRWASVSGGAPPAAMRLTERPRRRRRSRRSPRPGAAPRAPAWRWFPRAAAPRTATRARASDRRRASPRTPRRPPGCGRARPGSAAPASRSGTRSSSSCQQSVFSAAAASRRGRGGRDRRVGEQRLQPAARPFVGRIDVQRAPVPFRRGAARRRARMRCASARRASLIGVVSAIDVRVA